jgi:hypothetical protein
MDKRQWYQVWKFWRPFRPIYFLALALICGVVCVFALRANNLHMVELRQAVYQADKDNGDVEGALRNLREYVYGHMNTNLAAGTNVRPPIQLKYTYERLLAARNAGATANNSDIYNQAQKYCEQAIPDGFSGRYRLSCIQTYVKQHGLATSDPVPKNLYQFDFASPRWSADLAGWSLLATMAFLAIFVFGSLFRYVIRRASH